MGSLSSLFCIVTAIIVALIMLGIFAKRGNKKISAEASVNPTKPKWTGWLPYLVMAVVLSFWTVAGALFFLAVVWVMRQNPGPGSFLTPGEDEKKTARRIYTWLFFSSIFTVPLFVGMSTNSYGSLAINDGVLTALAPLIFHIPLLFGLTSKSPFVFRHTQQGLFLIALRAAMASIAVNIHGYPVDGSVLFLLGNGALWLFGSIWGNNQISRGECWLMKRKGDAPMVTKEGMDGLPPQTQDERSAERIGIYKREDAKNQALAAFRRGDRDVKLRAIKILDSLGEVEKF